VLNGILWVLRTGAPWQDMPDRYPSPATCHRRFQQWARSGVFAKILHALAVDLRDRGKLDLSECFIDASFVGAKKAGFAWALPSGARGPNSWQLRTAMVFLSPSTWPVLRQLRSSSSSPRSKPASFPDLPERLIGDKAYDSDPLAAKLAEGDGELIAPRRSNRKVKTQDGRPLRRYRRRWKIGRLFAWLYNYRRLVNRWEYDVLNFPGFVQLGCIVILLRRCL